MSKPVRQGVLFECLTQLDSEGIYTTMDSDDMLAGAYTRSLSAQLKRFLWDRGCIPGVCRGCLRGVRGCWRLCRVCFRLSNGSG